MDKKETIKVFVTKYALTDGIKTVDVVVSDSYPEMVTGPGLFEHYHGEGREWHRTMESAVAQAEKMRTRKIASMKKKLAKLENLKFA